MYVPNGLRPLNIRAVGRGRRQMCLMDRFGFPRTKPKHSGRIFGYKTGDMVRAVVPAGKKAGVHEGKFAVQATGSFRVGKVDGINHRYCCLIKRSDGYEYSRGESGLRHSHIPLSG